MAELKPMFAKAATAARMLDLTTEEFERLVSQGSLPKPTLIGGDHTRWDLQEIYRILSGQAVDGMEDVTW